MILHLKIIGIWLMILGMAHSGFFHYFNWKKELKALSLINRQLYLSHTFFIALAVFLMGTLCFFKSDLLVSTELGNMICLGFAIFWGFRFLFQQFYFSPKLWRGKSLETFIHIFFSLVWIYQTIVFFLIYKQ